MNEVSSKLKSFSGSFTLRLFLIGFLILVLLLPLGMVGSLVKEREGRYREAQTELASKWGGSQTIIGPFLRIPYSYGNSDFKEYINILPDTLDIETDVSPEVRSRGIFDVLLYTAKSKIRAVFPAPGSAYNTISSQNIALQNASLVFYVKDMKGLKEEISLSQNGNPVSVAPTTIAEYSTPVLQSADFSVGKNQATTFELTIPFQGSRELRFVPTGKKTIVSAKSIWEYPSFNGYFLPNERTIDKTGFSATWQISQFGRNIPSYIIDSQSRQNLFGNQMFRDYAFGVDFFFPADFYQKTTRSVKYGILFILFTFLAFFLFEVIHRIRVHPFQYMLVGIALCIFYLLELSFSEYLGFLPSYLIASVATIGLITSYCAKIFQNKKRGLIIGVELATLYSYLYFIINTTDYTLLIGSITVFFITALVMYLTRNINWYQVGEQKA